MLSYASSKGSWSCWMSFGVGSDQLSELTVNQGFILFCDDSAYNCFFSLKNNRTKCVQSMIWGIWSCPCKCVKMMFDMILDSFSCQSPTALYDNTIWRQWELGSENNRTYNFVWSVPAILWYPRCRFWEDFSVLDAGCASLYHAAVREREGHSAPL
jgi:hypothetical protein